MKQPARSRRLGYAKPPASRPPPSVQRVHSRAKRNMTMKADIDVFAELGKKGFKR